MDTNRHLRGYEALVNWFIGKTLAATALVLALFFASSTVKVQAATPPGLAYPLWDWRLVKDGALPQTVGYFPLEDVLSIKVEDGARLNVTPNQMVVVLQSQVAWKKEIAAWGSCQGTTSFVFTDGSNVGPNSMLITKGTCGTDTIVLRKAKAWGWMTDMYNLDLTNFWRLWAGKIVTITWVSDNPLPTPPNQGIANAYPMPCSSPCLPLGIPAPTLPPQGPYIIRAKNSGKVLDVPTSIDGASIRQFDYLSDPGEKWLLVPLPDGFFKIVSKLSGKALDVTGFSLSNGTLIQQYSYLGGDNQRWQLELVEDGFFKIVCKQSGKVLDVQGMSTSNGALIQQWDYLGGDNQKWQLILADDTYPPSASFKIAAKQTGKALDVQAASTTNGALIQQWDYIGGDNQNWQLVPAESGYFRIAAKHSGKVLDVQGMSTSNGAPIQQYDYLGGDNQKWRFILVQNGFFKIVAKQSGKVLDVQGASPSDGALIQQWNYLGSDNQKWSVEKN